MRTGFRHPSGPLCQITGGGSSGGGAATADGCVGFLCRTTVTLTDAQIKALPTTPVVAVAAPGSGYKLLLMRWHIATDFTAAYTNNQLLGTPNEAPVELYAIVDTGQPLVGPNAQIISSVLKPFINFLDNEANAGVLRYEGFVGNPTNPFNDNIGLYAWCDANTDSENAPLGNFTGGNAANTMTIVIYYLTVPV